MEDGQGGNTRDHWENDILKWYQEIGIQMTEVYNWVKDRRPICISTRRR